MRNVICSGLLAFGALLDGRPLRAQNDSTTRTAPRVVYEVRWYHGVAALGILGGLSLLDEPLRDNLQDHRSGGKDDVARVARRMGQPEIYGTVALGTLALGVISGDDRITRAGERIGVSLALAGLTTNILKPLLGRRRPNNSRSAYSFHPLASSEAFASGHTTMAFALAASVSDEVHSLPVSVALYGGATLTAWSRLNDNKHWLTDVLAGAAIGVTSAKLINGHWRVFGVRGPRFLLGPNEVGASLEF